MALLGKIRNQFGWVMMGLVILGVGGFLFMDISPGGGAGVSQKNRVVGKVNGESIYTRDFDAYMETYDGTQMSSEEKRMYAWDEIVSNMLIQQQADKLGLTITDAEMEDLYVGENISPLLMRQFMQSGQQYDRQQIEQSRMQYNQLLEKKELTPQEYEFFNNWKNLEQQVKMERLSSKYVRMIEKGVYSPGWMTSAEYNRNNSSYTFRYVQVPFTELPNTDFAVSEDDIKAYINEHPQQFQQEASASIEYVIFEVNPTQADIDTLKSDMQKIANELADNKSAKADTATIQRIEGTLDFKYYTKENWTGPEDIKDSLFAMDKGNVLGPYEEGGVFKVLKIMDAKRMPDSVKVSQIFKPAGQGSMEQFQQAQAYYMELDSLRKLLIAGEANFDSLVAKHSLDPTSKAKGGDIGWVKNGNQYGERFVDQVFSNLQQDTFQILQSEQGLHLAKITDIRLSEERGLRLASAQEAIIPSPTTEEAVEDLAHDFMINNRSHEAMINAVKDSAGLKTASASGLNINDFEIDAGIAGSRAAEIIKWTHTEGTVGEVDDEIYSFNDPSNSYVSKVLVVALTSKAPAGIATIDDDEVKFKVESIVRNQKKADFVRKKLEGINSLDEVASRVPEASDVSDPVRASYNTGTFNQITEHKVVAMAARTEVGKVSEPVVGEAGVYILQLVNKNDPPTMDVQSAKKAVAKSFLPTSIGSIRELVIEAIKTKVDIQDNRSEVY